MLAFRAATVEACAAVAEKSIKTDSYTAYQISGEILAILKEKTE
jgi:hypothetical protein